MRQQARGTKTAEEAATGLVAGTDKRAQRAPTQYRTGEGHGSRALISHFWTTYIVCCCRIPSYVGATAVQQGVNNYILTHPCTRPRECFPQTSQGKCNRETGPATRPVFSILSKRPRFHHCPMNARPHQRRCPLRHDNQ